MSRAVAAILTLDATVALTAGRIGLRVPGLTVWALCSVR
jgi:hypothetical protein